MIVSDEPTSANERGSGATLTPVGSRAPRTYSLAVNASTEVATAASSIAAELEALVLVLRYTRSRCVVEGSDTSLPVPQGVIGIGDVHDEYAVVWFHPSGSVTPGAAWFR